MCHCGVCDIHRSTCVHSLSRTHVPRSLRCEDADIARSMKDWQFKVSSAHVMVPRPSRLCHAAAEWRSSCAKAGSHGHLGGTLGRSSIAGARGTSGKRPHNSCQGNPPLPPIARLRGKSASPWHKALDQVWTYRAARTAQVHRL